jgi:hypothetical protein
MGRFIRPLNRTIDELQLPPRSGKSDRPDDQLSITKASLTTVFVHLLITLERKDKSVALPFVTYDP